MRSRDRRESRRRHGNENEPASGYDTQLKRAPFEPRTSEGMTQTVALPMWMLTILVLFAAWAVLDRLLLPSVRWYFRRRVNRVIEEINTRLNVEIAPFKLTQRRVLIDRLLYDPRVQAAVEAKAQAENITRAAVMARIEVYAREIVPSFNAYVYFRIGYWLAKNCAKFMYRVRIGYVDKEGIAAVAPKSTLVFVMNHRSNMDYVLVAFLAAEKVALSYAVGEWARVWPLQTLIRAMGAYFVRRNSGDPLYRVVLQRYVQMATEFGVPQAVFPEGGLTVDGKLRAPKLGLLDYMVKTFDPDGERDLVFVPIGINYDRVLEDRSLLLRLDGGARPPGTLRAAMISAGFIAKNLGMMLIGRWHRFGYACVNVGKPLSMRAYVAAQSLDFRALSDDERHARVAVLARELMSEIGQVIPALPVALVASVVVRHPGRTFSEIELKSEVFALIRRIEELGAHVYIPRKDHDYMIGVGLRMLTLRRIVDERDGLFSANAGEARMLAYYANALAHFGDDKGFR
jgi:glycerol-3-phosphate O-acyltransferase